MDATSRSRRKVVRRPLCRRVLALGVLAAIFALGALCARASLAAAPRSIAAARAQPLVVATAWGTYGAVAFALLAATLALGTVAIITIGLRLCKSAGSGDTRTIVVAAALALAAAGTWPFVFSSDVYAYAAYGDLALRGLTPYALAPANVHDAILDAARWQWGGSFPVCVYGPLMVSIARLVVATSSARAGTSAVPLALALLRGLAGLAFLASIAFARLALSGLEPRRRFVALAGYGLNPVVVWSVAEGHNDAFLLCALTAIAALGRARGRITAIFALALTPVLKAPGAVFALAAALDTLLVLRARAGIVLAALTAGSALAAAIVVPPMLPALMSLGAHGRYAPEVSVQGIVGPSAAIELVAVLAAIGCSLLAQRQRDGYAWLGLALAAALPNSYPWYGLWLVPWALAGEDRIAARALWAGTICTAVRYLPDAVGMVDGTAALILGTIAASPIIIALGGFRTAPASSQKVPARS